MDMSNENVGPASAGQEKRSGQKSKSGLIWSIILLIVLAVLVILLLDRVFGVNIITAQAERQQAEIADFLNETGAWHAVFLTNGQVYFGQLENQEAQYATLKDVYYLQIQQVQSQQVATQVAPAGESQVVPAPQPEPPRLTLIKFGTELHAPQDFMKINRDHILFWEELKGESQVVQAIQNYKAGQ